ncbi:carboxymuconolactone decarboxylase family protein [Paraburkholderia humisilvae]|uniref:Carboxymuconolactone decarboxylase-like domain-containing protein n=1 Tax=Paraburkholderia humisilvae TaxID=627669 RepID=A0A6J5EVC5_9BURK|nr:carboxymuconolactone decarboxylase family protein [Paraburkholderia humisilvae]CAB3770163.1 hypothetical protein LMG29542_06282 [Paraburkholderia humisilvae]
MARIPALSVSQAPTSTQQQLQALEKATGSVPNIFGTLANSQAAFGAFFQMQQPLGKGNLSVAEKESIALAVSQVGGCEYCLAAHTVLAGNAGLTGEAIRAARNGEGGAVAALARAIAQQRGHVSDTDLAKAREAGLSDSTMIEIVANVALVVFTNYLNSFAAHGPGLSAGLGLIGPKFDCRFSRTSDIRQSTVRAFASLQFNESIRQTMPFFATLLRKHGIPR